MKHMFKKKKKEGEERFVQRASTSYFLPWSYICLIKEREREEQTLSRYITSLFLVFLLINRLKYEYGTVFRLNCTLQLHLQLH